MSELPPGVPPPPPLPDALRARIMGAIQKEPAPTRTRVRIITGILVVVSAAVVIGFWMDPMLAVRLFSFIRPDAHPETPMPSGLEFSPFFSNGGLSWTRVAIAVGSAMLSAGIAVFAFTRGRSMVGRRGSLLVGLVFLAPIALLLWKWGVSRTLLADGTDWDPGREGFRCLEISLAMGLVPLAAALYLHRTSDPLHPMTTGAALGVATGAITWSVVDLTCPVGHPLHLLLGHLVPIVIFAMIGAIVGRLVVRIRAR